jgi:hypothetical protein
MHGKNVKFIAIKFPFNEVVEAILCRHKKNALSKKIDSQKIIWAILEIRWFHVKTCYEFRFSDTRRICGKKFEVLAQHLIILR